MRARVAVLASGEGSNLLALLDHLAQLGDARAADVVLVASNRPDARALARVRESGVPTAIVESLRHPDARPLGLLLEEFRIDLVVLAGYLALVPADVTRRYADRILNVHPGPLPQFGGAGMYGQRVHRAVLAAGATWSGPTVHFVDEIYDHGAVIAHWPVRVLAQDDEGALAARVLRAEHLLFPRVVQLVARQIRQNGVSALRVDDLAPFDPGLDDARLGEQVDSAFASVLPSL